MQSIGNYCKTLSLMSRKISLNGTEMAHIYDTVNNITPIT